MRRRSETAAERVGCCGEEEVERPLVRRGVGVAPLHDEVAEDEITHELAARAAGHADDELAVPDLGQPQDPAGIGIVGNATGDLQARHDARQGRAVWRVGRNCHGVRTRTEARIPGHLRRRGVRIAGSQVAADRALDVAHAGAECCGDHAAGVLRIGNARHQRERSAPGKQMDKAHRWFPLRKILVMRTFPQFGRGRQINRARSCIDDCLVLVAAARGCLIARKLLAVFLFPSPEEESC
jgi:hypothetical protein